MCFLRYRITIYYKKTYRQKSVLRVIMKQLTKVEEKIMHIIWKLDRCLVSDIIKQMSPEKPAHSTISSVVRILEDKGFVSHKAYGRTHEYFPIIQKSEYSKQRIHTFVKDYFQGSMNALVSFLVQEKDLSPEDLNEMLAQLEKDADSSNPSND